MQREPSVPPAARSAPRTSSLRRGLALGLAVAVAAPLGLRPRAAAAAPVAADSGRDEVDPTLERSRALYQEGLARFETFDYEGAVELWTKAYAELPEGADQVRNKLVYNIATAQQMAFEVDEDLQHLRRAVLLLEQYVQSFKALHQRTPEAQAEVDRANARVAELRERIDRTERGEDAPAEPSPAATSDADAHYGSGAIDGIVWTTPSATPLDADRLHRNRRLATEDHKTDRMLIGSYVALSVGGAATLAGAGTVLGARDAARGAGYGVLGLGVVGLATGFTLLAIGLERRKRARQGTLVAGAPMVAPGLAGAAVAVRF